MLNESGLNNMIIQRGFRSDSESIGIHKTANHKDRCPWKEQANSIAYRILQEYRGRDKNFIHREVVTLVSKSSSKNCTTFVLNYFDGDINSFIQTVYELSGKEDGTGQADTKPRDNKESASSAQKSKKRLAY